MRKLLSLYIIFALPFFANAQLAPTIQSPSPQVANLLSFESYPVELHTGIPDISLPIFSLQTRNLDVFENISMAYHPSGIKNDAPAGEIGKGWVLSASGGVIGRSVVGKLDETELQNQNPVIDDVFQYSINGSQGRFKLKLVNNQLVAEPYDYKGGKIEIDLQITNNTIVGIVLFDPSGLKYIFDAPESQEYRGPNNQPVISYNGAFYLTSVSDQNNNIILQYTYNDRATVVNPPSVSQSYRQRASIIAPGFGTIVFQYTPSNTYVNPVDLLDKVILRDVFGNTIKEAIIRRDKLEISSGSGLQKDIYLFEYQNALLPGGAVASFDAYGYPNYKPFCSLDASTNFNGSEFGTAPDYCTNGVLRRIIYPTGGNITFNFESNTYVKIKSAEIVDNSTSPPTITYKNVPDPNPVDGYNHPYRAEYYLDTPLQNYIFLAGDTNQRNFTVTTAGKYLLAATAVYTPPTGNGSQNPDPLSPLHPQNNPPSFSLYRSSGQLIGVIDRNMAKANRCYGQAFELTAGSYYILPSVILNGWQGNVSITKTEPNPNGPKFEYGGGIRIQSITYRDKNQEVVRQLNYSYNFFENSLQQYSSGFSVAGNEILSSVNTNGREAITYKNVRVSDSQNGWTDYEFTAGDDYP